MLRRRSLYPRLRSFFIFLNMSKQFNSNRMHGVVVPAFATSSSLLSTAQKALTLGDPQPWDLFQADMISSRQRLLVWEPCTPRLETRKCIKSAKLKLVWYIDNAGHPMLLACTNSGIALHRPNSRCCHCKTQRGSKT
jgi:hypothetical protein